jgi:hypothetical protein
MPLPLGSIDPKQMMMEAAIDRQQSYQDKSVRNIFKAWGAQAATLNFLAKRVNRATASRKLDMDWFNRTASFPVKFTAMRFHAKRKIDDLLRDMRLGTKLSKSPEVYALLDLMDSYPDEPVAIICKYPDWRDDIVFHALDHQIRPDGFQIVRSLGDTIYRVEYLSEFLRRFTEDWDPMWVAGYFE